MPSIIEWLFWLSIGLILYAYVGYGVIITLLARLRPRPVRQAAITPPLALVIPAYNEADCILAKISNSKSLNYPADRLRIIVVADGSTDDTVAFAQATGVDVYHQPQRQGKLAAMTRIVDKIEDGIIVFTDANTMLSGNALRAIARNFADPSVVAVSGEKRVTGGGEGLYWRYESYLKRCDSTFNSVIGAPGEIFALRRSHFRPLAEDTIVEDFVLSVQLVADGHRAVYEPEAVAYEEPATSLRGDWERRARNAAGVFRAMRQLRPLLHPKYGLVWWQYVSHKVLRWLTPFFMISAFIFNLLLINRSFYLLLFLGQVTLYLITAIGWWQASRQRARGPFYVIFYFMFANFAILQGFWRNLTNRQPVVWKKVR